MDSHEHQEPPLQSEGRGPTRTYRVLFSLEPQPEGGYTVTSPLLPELVTEGDTVEEALAHAREAFALIVEIYQEEGRALPTSVQQERMAGPIQTEQIIELAS